MIVDGVVLNDSFILSVPCAEYSAVNTQYWILKSHLIQLKYLLAVSAAARSSTSLKVSELVFLPTDHFNGPGRAIGLVFVSVWTVTFELHDRWPRYLASWFILTHSRSDSEFKVITVGMDDRGVRASWDIIGRKSWKQIPWKSGREFKTVNKSAAVDVINVYKVFMKKI